MATKSNGQKPTSATLTRFKTSIDVPADARAKINEILNQQLADTADLLLQTKHAHWNVRGSDFYQVHLLFDTLAECVVEWADEIAERVGQLGGYAMGTTRMAAANSRLPEFPTDVVDSMGVVAALVERWANYCATTRESIDKTDELGDPTTADLLTEVSRGADKNLWFLEAHLQS